MTAMHLLTFHDRINRMDHWKDAENEDARARLIAFTGIAFVIVCPTRVSTFILLYDRFFILAVSSSWQNSNKKASRSARRPVPLSRSAEVS